MSNKQADHIFLSMPGISEAMKPHLRKLLSGELLPVTTLRALVSTVDHERRELAAKKKEGPPSSGPSR